MDTNSRALRGVTVWLPSLHIHAMPSRMQHPDFVLDTSQTPQWVCPLKGRIQHSRLALLPVLALMLTMMRVPTLRAWAFQAIWSPHGSELFPRFKSVLGPLAALWEMKAVRAPTGLKAALVALSLVAFLGPTHKYTLPAYMWFWGILWVTRSVETPVIHLTASRRCLFAEKLLVGKRHQFEAVCTWAVCWSSYLAGLREDFLSDGLAWSAMPKVHTG